MQDKKTKDKDYITNYSDKPVKNRILYEDDDAKLADV
jgi:hypothetical protein